MLGKVIAVYRANRKNFVKDKARGSYRRRLQLERGSLMIVVIP